VLAKNLETVNNVNKVPIEVIDIDVHQETAMDYGIRSVPTLIMKDGNIEVKRFSGVRSLKELEEWING
jgi:thioredoxin-like negative regulator of GroEL